MAGGRGVEAEQSKPFMKFDLVKDGIAYRIEIPSELRKIPAKHRYSFDFTVYEHDSDVRFTKQVHLLSHLHSEKTDMEQTIIAVRALYGLLGTSDESRALGTNFPPEFLSFEKVDAKKTRQEILSYAQQRDDVLFDQPFHVIEFISAIHTNPRELVRQLQFWVSKDLFAFDVGTSFLASKHKWDDYIFKRMQLDKNRLRNAPIEIDSSEALTIADKYLATLNREAHVNNRDVFVVHGRNTDKVNTVARFLEKLECSPIILREKPNRSQTIIEKVERHSDVGFAVVLLTPDDEGRLCGDESWNLRARQNVIMELGYFMGRIGRDRVACILVETENFEKPSDIDGILYIPLDDQDTWQMKLAKELKDAGYTIDLNKVL